MEYQKRQLLPNLDTADYIFSPFHKFLQDKRLTYPVPALQPDWADVTIVFLSLNRVHLSMRLLTSIPQAMPRFGGKILIIDNQSDPKQLEELKAFLVDYPLPVALKEMERNYGVAGGRNRAAQWIETEWFLSVDNDMVFVGDPLESLQNAVDTFGAHYVNLPILQKDGRTVFACGGNLWIEPYLDSFALGNSSAYRQTLAAALRIRQPFLSTFLFGGASLIRKDTFTGHGMFDDAMLVGFEDLEFSLRLYQAGIKVATAASFCLIHAHEDALVKEDVAYEKARYAREQIKASADYFYAKHKIHVWTENVSRWVDEMQPKENAATPQAGDNLPPMPIRASGSGKPRIALIADAKGWVFENLCRRLVENLGDAFDFDVFYATEYGNTGVLLTDVRDYDLAHFFFRNDLFLLLEPWQVRYFQEKGWDYGDFLANVVGEMKITTSVFDHLFLEEQQISGLTPLFQSLTVGYTVSSQRLFRIYEGIAAYPSPTAVIEDGVDVDVFAPRNLERLVETDRELVVGWAGNSRWGMSIDGKDHKGLETIIKPAVAELAAEGVRVRGEYIDREVNRVAYSEMPKYYNSIDIYLCASDIEGTPNTVLEAMACGVPVISTDVGVVPEAFGSRQAAFIVSQRTVGAFKEKIRALADDPALRRGLAEENLERIRAWTWQAKMEKWRRFFVAVLAMDGGEQGAEWRARMLQKEAELAEMRYEIEKKKQEAQAHKAVADYASYRLALIENSRSYRLIHRLRETRVGRALLAAWARLHGEA